MLDTSKDVLNIIIAVSVLGFAFFACWAIFYFAMILRQGLKLFKDMRARITKIDDAIKAFKEKIEHSTSYLLLIGEGVKKLVEVMKERGEKSEKKKK